MAEFVELTDVREVGNLHDTDPADKYLQPHFAAAIREAKRKLGGASVYTSLAAGTSEHGAEGAADLKMAVCLLTLSGVLPSLNLKTRGEGIQLSESTSKGSFSGTTAFMTPAQTAMAVKAYWEEAMGLLDLYAPAPVALIRKVLAKDETA